MAVPEQLPIVSYVANGATDHFNITFDLSDERFLVVTVNNEIPQVGAFTVQDKDVVFSVKPEAGTIITLARDTDLERETTYSRYDNSFNPAALNWDLDKLWHVLQEQNLVDAKILARIKSEIEWRRTHDFNYDELAQVREKQQFDALKSYSEALLASANPGVFQGVIAGVVFARDGKSIQTHLEEILESLVQERESIKLKAAKTYVDEQLLNKQEQIDSKAPLAVTDTLQQQKVDKVYFDTTLSSFQNGAIKTYPTLAAANADIANIALNTKVSVLSATEGGDYYKASAGATSLTRSPYDPVETLRSWSNSNALFQPKSLINNEATAIDLNGIEYQNGYFLFTLTPKPQVHLNFPEYSNADGARGAGALIAVKEPSGTFARQLFITPDNIYFRATVSGVFENWIKLATSQEIEHLISKEDLKIELNHASENVAKNIFNTLGVSFLHENIYANYEIGSLTGNSSQSNSSFSTTNATARSKIFKVEPNTLYTVAKKSSNRFRIAEFSNFPIDRAKPVYFTKDEYVSSTKDEDVEYFTFTTQQTTSYIVVYVSSTSEEPVLHCYAGEYIAFQENIIIDKPVEINGELNLKAGLRVSGEFTSGNIVFGKNLFRESFYLEGNIVLSGAVGTERRIIVGTTTVNAKTAVLKINPNTTYTVSKSTSDRFRIGLCNVMPTLGTTNIEIIGGESNDSSSEFTFTSKSSTNYLVLYLAANTAAPSEVQVELGDVATTYESFGYKFFPEAKSSNQGNASVYDYAGVGNANFLSKATSTAGAWANSSYTVPAHDDTQTLQDLFDSARGVVSLEPNKKYKITAPIVADISKAKLIKGNMAHIVVVGDFEAFHWVGTLTSSANAGALNRKLALNEMSPLAIALRITNPMEVLGTAFVVEKCMSPNFLACNFSYLKRGIVFRGTNRNATISATHIYACYDYGIHFEEGGDIHQINITGSHISYCRKNIFSENHNIYNIQITGCDIETSSYPVAECDIHFLQTSAILEDLEITGCTIEDHWNTQKMIVLQGGSGNISAVTIAGNVTGNSAGCAIEASGVINIDISGNFKACRGYAIDIVGYASGVKINIQVGGSQGGGLLRAVGNFNILGLNLNGSSCTGTVNQQPVLIDVNNINYSSFSNMILKVSELTVDTETSKRPPAIHVKAKNMRLVKVDDNIIDSNVTLDDAIKVECSGTVVKGSMSRNMSTSGLFTAPAAFAVSGNA